MAAASAPAVVAALVRTAVPTQVRTAVPTPVLTAVPTQARTAALTRVRTPAPTAVRMADLMAVPMVDPTAAVDGREKPLKRPCAPHENGLRRRLLLASEADAKSELLPAEPCWKEFHFVHELPLTARFHLRVTSP